MTKYNIERIIGNKGLETITVNGFFLHSKYDPLTEAKQFAKKNYKAGNTHVLFGYGLGYIVEALKEEFVNNEKLIVIEPILTNIDEEKENIIVIKGSKIEEIEDIITKYISALNNISIICSPNYEKLSPLLFKEILVQLKHKVEMNRVNVNTINAMAQEWQKNYLFNIKNTLGDQSIEVLYKYSNLPVVVASGGPSLTKQLSLLKSVRDQIILIASGSTVNTLLLDNIEPDFVVSIDSQEVNYNHYKSAKFINAKFIYSMYSHYKIRERFPGEAYYFFSKGDADLLMHFNTIIQDNGIELDGGASVANFAFTIANYISNGPIALIGQDLAYTNMQTHAQNNKHFKIITDDEIKEKNMFMTKGYYDDDVLTDYTLYSMKRNFEQLLREIQLNEKIFNCTEGGIKIENFEQIPFKRFIGDFVDEKNIKSSLNTTDKKRDHHRIINNFLYELKIYEKIKILVNGNLRLLETNKSKTQFSSNILKKLNKNDELIERYRNNTALQVIMNPLSIKVFKDFKPKNIESAEEKYARILAQNKTLYNGYLEAIDITKQYILELCEILGKEKGE
ncbi:motility associated factor glycosyltransferase family protein [Lysinibacillus xylanilyticus]|uniref:motility associated factor glycosyltransferase family protein n=1 Tax=Lysinibacillus xylanilyticus TaxID=582475 RepID=UPI003D05D395